MLVFTAGLLLRLLKTGVYRLSDASLMVLMDAFTGKQGRAPAPSTQHPAHVGCAAGVLCAGVALAQGPDGAPVGPPCPPRAAVRNHPSNTLVREYWKMTEGGQQPRVVGVLASQLPSKPRPFDRLRQNLRKLCHSLQVRACVLRSAWAGRAGAPPPMSAACVARYVRPPLCLPS